jgi:hypothetical protein
MTERNLVCRVGNRLIGRSTRAAYGECLYAFWKERKERDLARDVGSEHRRDDGPEYESLDFLTVEVGALEQLRNTQLTEVYRRYRLECSARFCKRRPHASDYCDAAPVPECCHAGNIDGRRLSF